MRAAWRRVVPFLLAGILLLNVANAIVNGGRGNWIRVAVLALVLTLNVWRQGRTGG